MNNRYSDLLYERDVLHRQLADLELDVHNARNRVVSLISERQKFNDSVTELEQSALLQQRHVKMETSIDRCSRDHDKRVKSMASHTNRQLKRSTDQLDNQTITQLVTQSTGPSTEQLINCTFNLFNHR